MAVGVIVHRLAGWGRMAVAAVAAGRSMPVGHHTAAAAAGHMLVGRSLAGEDIGLGGIGPGCTGQVVLGRSLAEGGSLPGRSSLGSGYRRGRTF